MTVPSRILTSIFSALSVCTAICLCGCPTREPSEAARPASPQNVGRQWHQGTFGENGVRADIRVIAADTLQPVEGAQFQTILIGPDGGDGGFHEYTTNGSGRLTTNQYLYPGRYQIHIEPPAASRFDVTQYYGEDRYLVVREDGTYKPDEFKIAVR